jgi:WD40 repeat protein
VSHLYRSALPFTPEEQFIRQDFDSELTNSVRVVCGLEEWPRCFRVIEAYSNVHSAKFSPAGKLVAAALHNSHIELWDDATGLLRILEGHSEPVLDLSFSPNRKVLASCSLDHTLRLWDVSTGATLKTLFNHLDAVSSLSWSQSGKHVASGSRYYSAQVWDVASGASIRTINPNSSDSRKPNVWVAFSSSGILVTSRDTTAKLWDTGLRNYATLDGHTRPINSIVFSPNGTLVLSGSADGVLRLWDAKSGARLRSLIGHNDSVKHAAFSPDGKFFASGSRDGSIRLWNTMTGEIVSIFHTDPSVECVAFSPEARPSSQPLSPEYSCGMQLQSLEAHQYPSRNHFPSLSLHAVTSWPPPHTIAYTHWMRELEQYSGLARLIPNQLFASPSPRVAPTSPQPPPTVRSAYGKQPPLTQQEHKNIIEMP